MNIAGFLDWAGGLIVLIGAAHMAIGAFGLVRMPDVFTRMHAASVGDTFGVGLVLVGLMLIAGLSLVTVKLLFLLLFLVLVGPAATHAIARAALHAGHRPVGTDGEPLVAEAREAGEDARSKR
jgi:multicomponent Na+:H+ antiporter subunit G